MSDDKSLTVVEDELRALQYLEMRLDIDPETKRRYTQTGIAKEWGISRSTLKEWVARWEDTGVLSRVSADLQQSLKTDKLDAIRIASAALPDIIAQQVDDALHAKFANHRNAAAVFILQFLDMTKNLDIQDDADEGEQAYLETKPNFDPMNIAKGGVTVQMIVNTTTGEVLGGEIIDGKVIEEDIEEIQELPEPPKIGQGGSLP